MQMKYTEISFEDANVVMWCPIFTHAVLCPAVLPDICGAGYGLCVFCLQQRGRTVTVCIHMCIHIPGYLKVSIRSTPIQFFPVVISKPEEKNDYFMCSTILGLIF